MNEESIVDYSRQKHVNRIYIILLIIFIAVGAIWFTFNHNDFLTNVSVYIGFPVLILLLSSGLGALSKRAIDYNPGDWKTEEVWVTFKEYVCWMGRASGSLFIAIG